MNENPYSAPQSDLTPGPVSPGSLLAGRDVERLILPLRGARGWALFIAILLLGGALLLGTLSVFMIAVPFLGAATEEDPVMMAFAGCIYLVMALAMFLMGLMLIRFFAAAGRAADSPTVETLERAIDRQHGFWKLAGVLSLILLIVMGVGLIAVLIAATVSAF